MRILLQVNVLWFLSIVGICASFFALASTMETTVKQGVFILALIGFSALYGYLTGSRQ